MSIGHRTLAGHPDTKVLVTDETSEPRELFLDEALVEARLAQRYDAWVTFEIEGVPVLPYPDYSGFAPVDLP